MAYHKGVPLLLGVPNQSPFEILRSIGRIREKLRFWKMCRLCLKIVGWGKVGGVTVQVRLSTGCI